MFNHANHAFEFIKRLMLEPAREPLLSLDQSDLETLAIIFLIPSSARGVWNAGLISSG
jgi:hypothetical protein